VEQKANADLNKLFTDMEKEANRMRDKYNNESIEHGKTKEKLQTQTERKKKWRAISIGSLAVNFGLLYLILH
jgi:hypothetical protein